MPRNLDHLIKRVYDSSLYLMDYTPHFGTNDNLLAVLPEQIIGLPTSFRLGLESDILSLATVVALERDLVHVKARLGEVIDLAADDWRHRQHDEQRRRSENLRSDMMGSSTLCA